MIAKLFRHPVPRIIDAVLRVEIAVKTVDSIKSHLASAKLPAVKELADFDFVTSPVNEPLIHDLAGGGFLEAERSIVLVDRTGTGKIISPLPSRDPASARAHAAASTMWSIFRASASAMDRRRDAPGLSPALCRSSAIGASAATCSGPSSTASPTCESFSSPDFSNPLMH